jgi:hypothetical protein
VINFVLLVAIAGNTTIRELGSSGIEITFSAEKATREDFSFSDASWLSKAGEPDLPSLQYKIGIPQGGGVQVTVVNNDESVFKGVVIEPAYYVAVGETPDESPVFRGDVYKKNTFFPDNLFAVSDPGYFRDLYTVDLRINPVRYNPVTKELRVSRNIRINVEFKGVPVTRRALNDAYDNIYQKTVLNYAQCKNWQRVLQPSRQNPFAGAVWFKIEVEEEGIYKIGHDEIRNAGLDPEQFDPRTMKIYTAPYDVLPRGVPIPDSLDSLVEIPIYVRGEEDGVFDQDDYLVFYGHAASHFVPDTGVVWFENGYAIKNVYWFTFGGADGRRMAQIDAQYSGAPAANTVNALSHSEVDLGNPSRSGTNWYWADISPLSGAMGTAQITVHHPRAEGAAGVRAALFTLDAGTFWYRFALGGVTFYSDTVFLPTQDRMPPLYLSGSGSLTGDSSTLVFDVIRPAGNLTSLEAYLNAIDIEYERQAVLDAPFHAFFASPETYSIQCSGADAQTFVFDITELRAPKMLVNFTVSGNTLYLSSSADSFQMLYFSKLALATPAELQPSSPGILRTQGDGCEYLVIVHEDFYHAIMPLVEYRSHQYQTKLVLIDDIYNDFSFGKYDPLAIKHFLYYTMQNWSPYPKYVFLVGDATYDYKNNLGKDKPPNFVPMYEYGTYLSGNPVYIRNTLYEGEYVNFGQGEAMCLGRITVRTRQEVRDYIDKLITYETGDIVGPWTKRVLLSADDEYSSYGWENPSDHTGACEDNLGYIPDSLYDFAKIYMISYPPLGAGTAEKGNAREAFIREFNKGALIGLFYGHGNTHQLAHEVLFLSPYMVRINNGRRTPFFYFGSCNVGRFDDSDYECLGEEFVRIPDGAIGTIAATAGTGVGTNKAIGRRLCQYITNPDTILTMGECSVIARSVSWDAQYLLIGDPATKFRKIYDQMYLSRTPDSLRPLEKLNVVADNDRYHLKAFVRDTTHIEKFDASTADKISGYVFRQVQVSDIPTYVAYGYYIDGKEIYVGYWDTDTATIIAPRIATTHLPVIKLSGIYGDKSGMRDSIRVYGTAIPVADNTGPEVTLYEGGRLLNDGDWVDRQFILTGRVVDSSGVNLINSVESTNGFFMYINNQLDSKIDLRDYFYYVRNSFTNGEFNVALELPEAVDTLTINVVDNNFNQTLKRMVLHTELYGQVAIDNFLIYPNPLRSEEGLWFTFNLTRSGLVQLKIFTIAGRLIKTINNITATSGYNQVYWNSRDDVQDEISNGVYIVKAYVEADNSRAEVVEKFIIAR